MAPSNVQAQLEATDGTQSDVCEVFYINEKAVRAVAAQMPGDDTIGKVTNIFKVLGDPTRARIVFALARAELCVCDIAALVDLSMSAVSHQLRVLRNLGLVTYRKEGRLAYYALDDNHAGKLLQDVLRHVERHG